MRSASTFITIAFCLAAMGARPMASCTSRERALIKTSDSIVLRLEINNRATRNDFDLSIIIENNTTHEIRFGYSHLDMILSSGSNPHFDVFLKQSSTDSLILARRPKYAIEFEQLVVTPIAAGDETTIRIPSSWFIDEVPSGFDTVVVQYSGSSANSLFDPIGRIRSNECSILPR